LSVYSIVILFASFVVNTPDAAVTTTNKKSTQ